MLKSKWWFPIIDMQIFAEGGDGGGAAGAGDGAATTGGSADDPGRQALRALGVPENRIKQEHVQKVDAYRNAVRTASAGNAAAGGKPVTPTEEGHGSRMTWDEIMQDPEYNQKMQETVKARVKGAKATESNMKAMEPMIQLLAGSYGMDPSNLDYAKLAEAVTGDSRFYEDSAVENGRSVEDEMKMSRLEFEARQARQQRDTDMQQQMIASHFEKLEAQAAELQKEFPDFDLRQELRNDQFANAVSPGGGLSVKQAFYAFHSDEIRARESEAVAQMVARNASNAIRSGMSRPQEAGQSSTAPSSAKTSVRNLSRSDFAALKAELERRTAQGERCYL